VVVMAGLAGGVAVDVVGQLEASRHAGLDQRLHGPEHRGPPHPRAAAPNAVPELIGGELAPGAGQRIGHQQALGRDALARGAEAITGCAGGGHQMVAPTTPTHSEKR
jgi:hypothetical protein